MRIMHFADTHFGIETYGKIDPDTGLNSRLVDFRRSLDYAIDRALDAEIHAALFAGDAYKSRDPNQTHQREFASCIRRLTDAGIPVVMVTGNHDVPNSRAKANSIEIYRTLGIRNVTIISRPEVVKIKTSEGPLQVAGMPYLIKSSILSREETRDKTIEEIAELMVEKYGDYIDYLVRQLDKDLPSVLLGHFWIKNAKVGMQGSYLNVAEPEVLVSTVANPAFDFVAMGHIHKHQDLNKRGAPPVVYAGSIDRVDFGERGEEKGFVLADVEKGRADYNFVRIPTRRFVEIEVDLDVPVGSFETDGGEEEPTAEILHAIEKSDIEDAVVKLIYRVPQEKLPLIRENDIRDALNAAFLVVSLTRDVRRQDRAVRNRLLTESLDPVRALEMYFDARDEKKKRRSELMDYARPLIEELLAEEQVQ